MAFKVACILLLVAVTCHGLPHPGHNNEADGCFGGAFSGQSPGFILGRKSGKGQPIGGKGVQNGAGGKNGQSSNGGKSSQGALSEPKHGNQAGLGGKGQNVKENKN